MRRSAHAILFALALTAAAPAADARQVSAATAVLETPQSDGTERPMKTGTARIRGRVVTADTGAVVRRAQVSLTGTDIGGQTAVTDTQGRYEFRDLPAGRFTLSVSKPGFLDTRYGQTHPSQRGRRIELADGQRLDKADVALPRGGAVSGRILDEFGDPIPDATVTALRLQRASGQRRLVSTGRTSTTSDLGTFRLFGLGPGEYYVSATVRSFESMAIMHVAAGGATGSNTTGHAATYYPNTPNPAEAQAIALTAGQEVSVDVQMSPVRLARITGTAVSAEGMPMSRAMVMLIPKTMEDVGMMGWGTETDKDGRFALSGVPPGEYTVQVQSLAALMSEAMEFMSAYGDKANAAPPSAAGNREFAMAAVTVAGEDIAGLTIAARRGAKARGRVVFEHGRIPDDLTSLRVMAEPRDVHNVHLEGPPAQATLKENATFEIDGLAGRRVFQIMDPPKGWFLKRATHGGNDITDNGYVFTPAEDVDGFEIVMTTRPQIVTGSVANDKGTPVDESTVIVFPQDPDKWTGDGGRSYAFAQSDQSGHFRISELPAGSYFAIAIDADVAVDWTDPEWLGRAAKTATRFTLEEGATKRLDLKLSGSW